MAAMQFALPCRQAVRELEHQSIRCLRTAPLLPGVYSQAGRHTRHRLRTCSSSSNGAVPSHNVQYGSFKLIIYSKADCPLCDGLKEKLKGLLQRAEFQPSLLSGAKLETRDITSNPDWETAYGLAIPVLTHAAIDNKYERKIPRPSPRLSADRLEQHIVKALTGS